MHGGRSLHKGDVQVSRFQRVLKDSDGGRRRSFPNSGFSFESFG